MTDPHGPWTCEACGTDNQADDEHCQQCDQWRTDQDHADDTEQTAHPVPDQTARHNTTALPPTLLALRDLIAAEPGAMTDAEALASARTVLAAHTRELADIAHTEGNALYDDMGQKAAAGAWYVRDRLRAVADGLGTAAAGGEQA